MVRGALAGWEIWWKNVFWLFEAVSFGKRGRDLVSSCG